MAAGHAGHASADDILFKFPLRWRRRLEVADEGAGRRAGEVSRARTRTLLMRAAPSRAAPAVMC